MGFGHQFNTEFFQQFFGARVYLMYIIKGSMFVPRKVDIYMSCTLVHDIKQLSGSKSFHLLSSGKTAVVSEYASRISGTKNKVGLFQQDYLSSCLFCTKGRGNT